MQKGAAQCRNRLTPNYTYRDAVDDLQEALAQAEASRNREPARKGRGSWGIPRKW